jgi:hypothetical protein
VPTKLSKKKREARRQLEYEKEKKTKRCGAKKKNGDLCHQPAGFGTRHEGSGRCRYHGGASPSHEVGEVRKAANEFARPVEVTPGQALAGVLHMAAGQLTWVSMRVAELKDEQIVGEMGVDPLVRFQRAIMLDVAKYAKIAHEAGIDERLASLAEEQTLMVARLIESVAGDLDLTPEQKAKLGPAVRTHLSLLQGGVIEGSESGGEKAA